MPSFIELMAAHNGRLSGAIIIAVLQSRGSVHARVDFNIRGFALVH